MVNRRIILYFFPIPSGFGMGKKYNTGSPARSARATRQAGDILFELHRRQLDSLRKGQVGVRNDAPRHQVQGEGAGLDVDAVEWRAARPPAAGFINMTDPPV